MENIFTKNEINELTEAFDDRSNGPRPVVNEDAATASENADESGSGELTMEWIMTRYDRLLKDKDYIKEIVNALTSITSSVDGTGASKADGIKEAMRVWEETNRRLLDMLSMMFAQLNSKNPPPQFNPVNFNIPPLNPIPPLPPSMAPQEETSSFSNMINAIRGIDWDDLPDEIREAITEAIESKSLKPDKLKKMMEDIKSVDWDDVPDEVREAVAESLRNSIM
jgi:hypothetical protein